MSFKCLNKNIYHELLYKDRISKHVGFVTSLENSTIPVASLSSGLTIFALPIVQINTKTQEESFTVHICELEPKFGAKLVAQLDSFE